MVFHTDENLTLNLVIGQGYYIISDWEGKRINMTMVMRTIITYLVSYRPSIEIWWVCNVKSIEGEVKSVTDQISVLFRRGPYFMYTIPKIIKITTPLIHKWQVFLHTKM